MAINCQAEAVVVKKCCHNSTCNHNLPDVALSVVIASVVCNIHCTTQCVIHNAVWVSELRLCPTCIEVSEGTPRQRRDTIGVKIYSTYLIVVKITDIRNVPHNVARDAVRVVKSCIGPNSVGCSSCAASTASQEYRAAVVHKAVNRVQVPRDVHNVAPTVYGDINGKGCVAGQRRHYHLHRYD